MRQKHGVSIAKVVKSFPDIRQIHMKYLDVISGKHCKRKYVRNIHDELASRVLEGKHFKNEKTMLSMLY